MNLTLTPEQFVMLRNIVVDADCTTGDLVAALALYPGKLVPGDVIVETISVGIQLDRCTKQTATESSYLGASFILRMVELGWAKEAVQTGVVRRVPDLVRPPRVLDEQIAAVKAGLDALTWRLVARPVRTGYGDPQTFERVCEARDDIANALDALGHFAALKGLHDALHLIQVLGAPWLDSIASPATTVSAPLQTLIDRAKAEAARPAAGLPQDAADCWTRCGDTLIEAERRLGLGIDDERDYAHALLRAMLIKELPRLDLAMFAVSRQFPLRRLCLIFEDAAVKEATVDLYDTLRRRMMEHALWQVTDSRLYAVEQSLVSPTPSLYGQLSRGPLPLAMYSLRLLIGPEAAPRVTGPMTDAVTRYVQSTDSGAPAAGAAPCSLDEVCTAFAALRDAARSSFLEVDQALKRDFAGLLVLQDGLRSLLQRVPVVCEVWLADPAQV